jgi:hypothetical protein
MTKDEFLGRVEQFDLVTESAGLLDFLDHQYPVFRDLLTDTELSWVQDRARTAAMTAAYLDEAEASAGTAKQHAAAS